MVFTSQMMIWLLININKTKTNKIVFYLDFFCFFFHEQKNLDRKLTLGNIWAACGEDCKKATKGFNSFACSFNNPSAAFRAALHVWTSPVLERSRNDASNLSWIAKHLLKIFSTCWIVASTYKYQESSSEWIFFFPFYFQLIYRTNIIFTSSHCNFAK